MQKINIEQARFNMIEQQIRTWEVLDQGVLDLLARVPREAFVPPRFRNLAFADMNVPLGHDQIMMQPKEEARLVQVLTLDPEDIVLEIGTGSGYLTALLASRGKHVYSVDIIPDFKMAAQHKLGAHGINNFTLETGDAATGWSQHAPYDAIAVTGSLPILAENFQNSLSIGGRLFVIVGVAPAMEAILITRLGKTQFSRESLFETAIPALINAQRPPAFLF